MSNVKTRPRLNSKLVDVRGETRGEVEEAFSGCEGVRLGQGWKADLDPDFRSAEVRVGRGKDALLVWAELQDEDIFNLEARFNHPFYRCGDVFEVFLRPTNQEAYTELHVGPANQNFQLRIPSAATFTEHLANPEGWQQWVVPERFFESQVWIEPGLARWWVLARIPFRSISEQPVKKGDTWLFSFSRYDYTRGKAEPVYSSSSPHAQLSFHRQQEWGTLTFD